MSGDVQPRKRKDKRKKRDAFEHKSEEDISISRQSSIQEDDESSHGVHITKMGNDDVHLHVQHDHGTGGHWCAKVFFFSLLAVLLGLIALIILENRGLADLDTPLAESRFSNYFDGWVDESRDAHDHGHDAVKASIEEHDEHDEPFEEVEDHSEIDDEEENGDDDEKAEEEEEQDVDDDEKAEDEDEEEEEEEKTQTAEEEEEEEVDQTREGLSKDINDVENEDYEEQGDNDEEDDEENEVEDEEGTAEAISKDVDVDDDEEQENPEVNNEDEDDDENDDNEEDDEDNVEDLTEPLYVRSMEHLSQQQQSTANNEDDDNNENEEEDAFDEEDDDGTFESVEQVVDNDAEEQQLLKQKAHQQAAAAAKNAPSAIEGDDKAASTESPSSWLSSLAVKIGVGVALALVARLVLIRKNPYTIEEGDTAGEATMTRRVRRLTIANEDDNLADDEDADESLPLPEEDEYTDEEVIIEEEIEYVDDDDETEQWKIRTYGHYVPETFEQLNAMYRPKGYPATTTENVLTTPVTMSKDGAARDLERPSPVFKAPPPPPPLSNAQAQRSKPVVAAAAVAAATAATATAIPGNLEPATVAVSPPTIPNPATVLVDSPDRVSWGTTREVTHDLDYEPPEQDEYIDNNDDNDIVLDDENYDDEEELVEEEEEYEIDEDEEDVSDVDDSELMNRLEAKYGKLPGTGKEYESDEHPDDPTWTQIKPKKSNGGPQAVNDDDDDEDDNNDDDFDTFEKELRRANEEMMREFNYQ